MKLTYWDCFKSIMVGVLSVSSLFNVIAFGETCVLGCRSCREGYEYTCDKCGSEHCWILSGGKCSYKDIQCQLPPNEGNMLPLLDSSVLQQRKPFSTLGLIHDTP